MDRVKTGNRLFWKISATLLVLLGVVGGLYVMITAFTARRYLQETNQRLYGGIADSTVQVVRPLVDGRVDTSAIQDIMHSMMVINPSVEVYLLDTTGRIITYVAPNKRVKLERVDLGPVLTFIRGGGNVFIRGDDPRHPEVPQVFSAAPIREGNRLTGYLYIILAGEEQQAVAATLSGSYMLRLGLGLFFLALAAALVIGLLAIWYLTKNLRRVALTVQRFKDGDLKARIPAKEKGDLGPLADTFNAMADTIVDQFDRMKSLENLRRELIANVSHDLRTPLAIMQGYVETMLLKENSLEVEERRRYLRIVLNSAEKLGALIGQLFEYSKLEARQVTPDKEPFPLSDLTQDIIQKYQLLARDRHIRLQLDCPQQLPLVFADIALVERVIQNLIDNALKFTPEGGNVTIILRQHADSVEVRIQDSGPGVPEAEQAHIFERYRQGAEAGIKTKGAGLGLAIARKILELHDSTIRINSRLNEGTAFFFHLQAFGD